MRIDLAGPVATAAPSLKAVGRMGFLRETGYPLGRRLHLHLGVGPSFVWTRAEFRTSPFAGTKDTDFTVGVQALAGVKYFITKNLAVFGEYKFKHWDPGFRFSTEDSVGRLFSEKFNPDGLDVNVFNTGLAFHF